MKKGPDNVQNKINKETEQAGEWKELTGDPSLSLPHYYRLPVREGHELT